MPEGEEGVRSMISAEEAVLNAMKNEGRPVRPGDVVEITGLDKNDVSKAIKELRKKGLIDSPKRCFYAPVK
jgi:DNA-binding MarR family transcriptional regulator